MILQPLVAAIAPADAPSFTDRIQAEGDALIGVLGSPYTWLYMAALVFVLVGSWWLRRLILDMDMVSQQVRTLATSVLSTVTLLLALAVSLIFLHRQAPLVTAMVIVILGVISTVILAINSRGWVRAIIALWRGRIGVGDRLEVAGLAGRVTDVGLFRVIVENDDGGLVYIPTDRFGQEVYTVSSPERVFPVEVHIVVDGARLTEADLESLRRIATLSPYRENDSFIAVEPSPEPSRATVRFRSWSEDGARLARAHLVTSFENQRASQRRLGTRT